MRIAILLSTCVLVATAAASCSNTPPPPPPHLDGGTDAGSSSSATTVQAVVSAGASNPTTVEITDAVVVAAYSYTSSSGGVTGTFYIQDQAPNSGAGVAVYVSSKDSVSFPAIGEIVSVRGVLSTYEGALQIAGTSSTPLVVNDTANNGQSSSGAYPPAGAFTMVTAGSDYASSAGSDAHPEQVGTALQFAGPLQVTDMQPADFVKTAADGGTSTQGFEISGGIWVDDSNIYYNCMRHLGPDGGTLFPNLEGGIRGVWDRYQDPGNSSATVYPVLIPMSCDDLNPLGLDAGFPPVDAGSPDDGGTITMGGTDGGMTTGGGHSVQSVVNMGASSAQAVEVDNAVVVAAYAYQATTGGVTGTFYIQDQAPNSGNGLQVYVASTDTAMFPSLGDIVTVTGFLSVYDGALQLSSSTTPAVTLAITKTGSNGHSSAGAYTPAGLPKLFSSTSGFAATMANAHPELVGNAIQFSGAMQVTNQAPTGFISTKTDGGTVPEGFEITGGVWVNDTNVFYDCMRHLGPDGGTLYPTLSNGIRGVWDRYEDHDAGSVYPVLVPMSCADLNPTAAADGGSPQVDAGTPGTDAGMTTGGGHSVQSVVNMGASSTVEPVEVDDAVVIAAYSYQATNGNSTGVFYVQDQAPNGGNGLEVYVASTDSVTFPAVGDLVTVTGVLSVYNGALQISSSTTPAVALTVTNKGSNGMASSGAYSPAGAAKTFSSTTGFEATTANAHPELVGAAIQFAGPLAVTKTAPSGFVTRKTDGGVVPEGFEITGGVWVDDSNVYYDCMRQKAADGGTLYPTLTTGIRGVWDRFQDGDAGSVYPVLVPMGCSDFSP